PHHLERIVINKDLARASKPPTAGHEFSHWVDDMASTAGQSNGMPLSRFLTEMEENYKSLNRGNTPATHGYGIDDIDFELRAETIRAYMMFPGYFKATYPHLAAEIRKWANADPRISHIIQFNSLGGLSLLGGGGLLGGGIVGGGQKGGPEHQA